MKLINYPTITIIFISLFLTGCPREVKPPYDFKSQNLKGKINNQPWEYSSGVARPSFTSEDTLRVGIYNAEFDNSCSYAISENGILFNVPKAEGLYILNANWDNFQTVTLYHGTTKEYGLGGAIEIVNIDYEARTISGRIDATVDNNSSVNGNFLITLCD